MTRTTRINLSHNENHVGPTDAAVAALHGLTGRDLACYSPSFAASTTSPLTLDLARRSGIPPHHVALGYGAEPLLQAALRDHVAPGQVIALPSASWPHYRTLAAAARASVVTYPVVEGRDRDTGQPAWVVDVDALLALRRTTDVRVLLVASPANPTGNPFPADRLDEVLAAYRDALVVLDEAYYGLGDDEPDFTATPQLTREHPNLLVVRSFSKLYGLASPRIGWCAGGDQLTPWIAAQESYLGYSRPNEVMALAALDDPGHYETVRQHMIAARATVGVQLAAAGYTVYRSAANFLAIRPPATRREAARAALDAARIKVKWLDDLGILRVTLGTDDMNDALVRALTGPRRRRGGRGSAAAVAAYGADCLTPAVAGSGA